MEKNQNENLPEKETPNDKILDKAADTFDWWNRMATINKDDSIWVGFLKIILRIAGILFLIAISPLVLLGLFVAFTAAF